MALRTRCVHEKKRRVVEGKELEEGKMALTRRCEKRIPLPL